MKITYNTRMVGSSLRICKRFFAVALCAALAVSGTGFIPRHAAAADLINRSLHIYSPTANAVTRHTFTFSYATTGSPVGSLQFEYCTSPLPAIACVAPPGIDASGAVLADQQGETGYVVLSAQPSRIILSRPALPPTSNPSQYSFDGIVNPDGTPKTFYVRITSYTTLDATGPNTDFGAVVNSITDGLHISGEVPPLLNFCVGLSIGSDCSSANGNLIDLGDLRTTVASSGTSEMMVATNAEFGVNIAVYGTTMTSGNNVIPALNSPTPSAPGNSQFGLNLRSNSNPGVGQNPSGAGATTPTVNYNIPNRYTFNSGDIVAVSASATDTRKFTSSYVVNVSPSQAPGVYTSTLTYICTASF